MDGCFTFKGAITVLLIFLFFPFAYVYLRIDRGCRQLENQLKYKYDQRTKLL